jgi:hypothetical protein
VRECRVNISVSSDNDNCPLDLEPDRVRDRRTLVHRHSSCSNRLSPSYSFPPCISPTLSLLPYLPLTLLSSNAYPNSFRPVSLARTDPSSFPFSQTQDSIPRTPYSSFQAANFQRNRHQCVFLTVDFFLFAPPRDFPPILSRFFPSPSLFFFLFLLPHHLIPSSLSSSPRRGPPGVSVRFLKFGHLMFSHLQLSHTPTRMGNLRMCVSLQSISRFRLLSAPHSPFDTPGNSRLPQLTQTNLVNIYLFHAESGIMVLSVLNEINPFGRAGSIAQQVNDTWFPNKGLDFNGTPTSYPYYWVITRADATLDGSEVPQATFSAVREYSPSLCRSACQETTIPL